MPGIEIGEYVRTKFSIGKVKSIGIDENLIYFKNYECLKCVDKEQIVKHSKNIIDLIEVGDYVNRGYIYEIGQAENKQKWVHTLNGLLLYEQDIKSIVTKEQFAQVQYEVRD